ncbi:MAG: phage holin [Oscillospiraceae bacterium]
MSGKQAAQERNDGVSSRAVQAGFRSIIHRKFKGVKEMINWKVRIKNKTFWLTLIPAVLLLVQVIAAVFGYTLDLGELGNRLLAVVNALFTVLTILGIVTDPTTAGVADSKQALTYVKPKPKEKA